MYVTHWHTGVTHWHRGVTLAQGCDTLAHVCAPLTVVGEPTRPCGHPKWGWGLWDPQHGAQGWAPLVPCGRGTLGKRRVPLEFCSGHGETGGCPRWREVPALPRTPRHPKVLPAPQGAHPGSPRRPQPRREALPCSPWNKEVAVSAPHRPITIGNPICSASAGMAHRHGPCPRWQPGPGGTRGTHGLGGQSQRGFTFPWHP